MTIKKIVLIIIIIIGAAMMVLTLRLLSGSEDTWICQNGQWIKHGQPLAPRPTSGCGKETMTIKLFFNNSKLDAEFSCNKVSPVERKIDKTEAVARKALELLLEGNLTLQEREEGFLTSINPGVKIQSLTIEDGVAKVDFDEQLEFQVGGSCRVSAIRAQITQTLKQFPTVENVIISIDGRTEDILQP
jgi:spore germination protein GerM